MPYQQLQSEVALGTLSCALANVGELLNYE